MDVILLLVGKKKKYTTSMYDYIIVGGGISGLYVAFRLLCRNPSVKLLILEQKGTIGGRAGTELFYDVPIATGAGIGRKKKDVRLLRLMKKLGVPVSYYIVKKQCVGFESVPLLKVVKQLQKAWKKEYKAHPFDICFKEFALQQLGEKMYNQFVLTSGYSDYENENAWSTLFHYGMDDNADNWKAFFVPWSVLESKMVEHVGSHRIRLNQRVVTITGSFETEFCVTTNTLQKWYGKQVILASTISTVQRLVSLKGLRFQPLLNKIKSQPFLRIYGKFSVDSAAIVQKYVHGFTLVTGPLQKIIPIRPDKGVYMICYNDNDHAEVLKHRVANTVYNCMYLCNLFCTALGITERLVLQGIRGFYWHEGTHYYSKRPFQKEMIQSDQGITIVGEMISTNQGWAEGALESVDKIINNI